MAVFSGLLEVTRILIERHADINARDSDSTTPLHITCSELYNELGTSFDGKYFEVVRILLEHGAEVDAQADIGNSTPLHVASWFGGVKVAQLLLEHGAKVDARNEEGCTPLLKSLIGLEDTFADSCLGVIRLLLEHGADINAPNNDHSTPLHVASRYGSLKAVRLLLEHGASVHLENNEGQTLSKSPRIQRWVTKRSRGCCPSI
jgi:ankyrin repeat protein